MNRLRASLLRVSILALAALCCVREAQAQAVPPPGKALVVLYRSDKQPVAGKVPVIVNADRLGNLGNGEYINAVVNPGRTFLRVGDRILTTLAIQTSANQTSYVLVEAVPGQTPLRVEMREMSRASASRALAQSRAAAAGVAAAAAPAAAASRVPAAAAAPPPRQTPVQPAPVPQRQVQAAPPPPKPKPAPPPPPSEHAREPSTDYSDEAHWAVIAKTGAFKLSTPNQPVGGLQSTYDKASKPVGAVEIEYRDPVGYAIGGEVIYYKNTFTPDGTSLKGEQTVLAGSLNAKYYVEATEWLYPFLGVGLGYASSTFGGDFTGKAGSFAFQAMAGADVRFSDSVGLYLEYKYLNAPTRDNTGQEIKAGGSGVLVGLSFQF